METEKGEITWSTQTEHRKSTSEETNETVTKETATTASKKDKGMYEFTFNPRLTLEFCSLSDFILCLNASK